MIEVSPSRLVLPANGRTCIVRPFGYRLLSCGDKAMRARILSLSVLLALALGATDADAQPIKLKFSHFLGPTSFFQLDVVEPWARELEAKTNGRVKVEIHDGTSPLGKVTEQASAAQAVRCRRQPPPSPCRSFSLRAPWPKVRRR